MSDNPPDGPSARESSTRSVSDIEATHESTPNTSLNALIGGVVGVVLSFIPLSTVLGGAVAGYLEGGDYASGAKVGAFAGLIALVPFVFLVGLMLFFTPMMGSPGPGSTVAFWVMLIFALGFAAIYIVGFSALGGILGAYVKREV